MGPEALEIDAEIGRDVLAWEDSVVIEEYFGAAPDQAETHHDYVFPPPSQSSTYTVNKMAAATVKPKKSAANHDPSSSRDAGPSLPYVIGMPLAGRYFAACSVSSFVQGGQGADVLRRHPPIAKAHPNNATVPWAQSGVTVMWSASSPGTSPPRMRIARSSSAIGRVWVCSLERSYSPLLSTRIA